MDRRRSIVTLAAAAASPWAGAQTPADYPKGPVTLLVAYPPGGSTDLVARIIERELGKRLGTTMVIENVGGAGGTIGAQRVAAAVPDGQTLLLGTNNEMAIGKLINPSVRYDPQRQFAPIGLIGSQPMVLVAAPHTGVKTADDFVRIVKSKPGKFSYGSSGVGTGLHLAGEMIKQSTGVYVVHIPYRGVGPLTNDLLGGALDFGVFVLSSGLPAIRSGKVAAIGITAPLRARAAPEIAPLSDHPAMKGVDISSWFALFAPAGLKAPVAARLREAFTDTMATAEVRSKLEDAGVTLAAASPQPPDVRLAAYLAAETGKYARIVEFANIKE